LSGAEVGIAVAAIAVGSLLKSITGMGVPVVAIPVISLVVGVEEAVIVVALPNLLLNLVLAWRERSHLDATRDLPMLGFTGVVGAVLGTLLLVAVPDEPLVVLLAVAVLGYVATFVLGVEPTMKPETASRWAPGVGLSAGFMQGAVGISGPLIGTWIHSYRLGRASYILSVTTLFSLAGAAQLAVLLGGSELAGLWTPTLLACVPALATVPVGARLRGRMTSHTFDGLIVGVLALAAVVLVVRAFA